MRDLFPTGQTTISQSESRSEGTSTSHSDSISCKNKQTKFSFLANIHIFPYWHTQNETGPGLRSFLVSFSPPPSPLPQSFRPSPAPPPPPSVFPCPPPHRYLPLSSRRWPAAVHGSHSSTFYCHHKKKQHANINHGTIQTKWNSLCLP